jgi:tetratricopeptide (TPR) repeat protein
VASEQTDEQPQVPLEESELLFRLQMKVADVFFEHWKSGLTLLILVLIVVLGASLYQGRVVQTLQESSASIAAVDRKLPVPDQMAELGFAPLDDLGDPKRVRLLEAIANKYEAIAGDATRAPAAEAWIKAGDVWTRLENTEKSAAAYASSLAAFDQGVYGYTARNALATAHLATGNAAGAVALYRDLSKGQKGYPAERALADLADALEQDGQTQEAIDTWRAFGTQFPDSVLAEDAVTQLGRLESHADSPSTGE